MPCHSRLNHYSFYLSAKIIVNNYLKIINSKNSATLSLMETI